MVASYPLMKPKLKNARDIDLICPGDLSRLDLITCLRVRGSHSSHTISDSETISIGHIRDGIAHILPVRISLSGQLRREDH